MYKQLGKIATYTSFFFGTISAMNLQRNPQWQCPEHTKSKTVLATQAVLDLGISGAVAYVGLRDTQFMRYMFGDRTDATSVAIVAGGTQDQRLAIVDAETPEKKCLKYLAFSGILLCDAGSNLWKIRNYRNYVQQKHATHHCLTDHKCD